VNVLIANIMSPFVRGAAEELADHLCARLNRTAGVQAELLRIPFALEPFERLPDEIFLNRMLQLHNVDRMIALKFPAYLIPHEKKAVWLLGRDAKSVWDSLDVTWHNTIEELLS
jgi:hypothetical protein